MCARTIFAGGVDKKWVRDAEKVDIFLNNIHIY